jgi:hypothetical protein
MKILDNLNPNIRLNVIEALSLTSLVDRKARIRVWLLGLILLLAGGVVHAEGGCPSGMIPEGGQGVSSCRPIPGYQQSRGHWMNQWGAITSDFPHHSAGASFNQPSEEEAVQAAMANCVSNGGVQCKLEITYGNECVAMVVGTTGHNSDRAKTIDQAVKLGMKVCTDAGDTDCHAFYTACSLPKWVQ